MASHLLLWLVLLACLRATGLSQAQVPWQTSLAAFAFVRLLTVLPLTPGGVGITELGLVGVLAAGAGHQVSAQVAAAVLLYRAVTYLPPIPLGAVVCLVWQHMPAVRRADRAASAGELGIADAGPAAHNHHRDAPSDPASAGGSTVSDGSTVSGGSTVSDEYWPPRGDAARPVRLRPAQAD